MRGILLLLLSATVDSLHFQLRKEYAILCSGKFARIGRENAFFEIVNGDEEPYSEAVGIIDHRVALRSLIDRFHRNSRISALSDIDAVIYRVPHGGGIFPSTTIMNREQMHRLHEIAYLSVDLPACVTLIGAGLSQVPNVAHVAVFENGLTSSLPFEAKTYAIDATLAKTLHVQRFGFFGILHTGAIHMAREVVKKKTKTYPQRVVSVHIDDRTSVVALVGDVAVEASTGFTAGEGLPGLRGAGSVDPRLPLYLAALLKSTPQHTDAILNNHSGIAALTGRRSWEEIHRGIKERDRSCIDAIILLAYRVAQSVAGMLASLGNIDMIVFSGKGSSWVLIEEVCRRLSSLGVHAVADIRTHSSAIVSAPRSSILVLAVSLTEEDALVRTGLLALESDEALRHAPPVFSKKKKSSSRAKKKKTSPRKKTISSRKKKRTSRK